MAGPAAARASANTADDEAGNAKLHRLGSHLFFELVRKRFKQGATILTSNKSHGV